MLCYNVHQSHELRATSCSLSFHLEEIKLLIMSIINRPDLDTSAWSCKSTIHVHHKSSINIHDIKEWIGRVGINWWTKHPQLHD